MKPTHQRTEPHRANSALALKSVERAQQARVPNYYLPPCDNAKSYSKSSGHERRSRQGAMCVVDGPIGFRSGTDPEGVKQVERGVPCSHENRETINPIKPNQIIQAPRLENQNHDKNN